MDSVSRSKPVRSGCAFSLPTSTWIFEGGLPPFEAGSAASAADTEDFSANRSIARESLVEKKDKKCSQYRHRKRCSPRAILTKPYSQTLLNKCVPVPSQTAAIPYRRKMRLIQ
jgi:hypothetical protein